MAIIDLSYTLNNQTSVYAGDPPVEVVASGELEKDGFADHKVSFGTHIGTHMDAPAHMIIGGKKLMDYPIERFMVRGICLDVRSGFHAQDIEAADIQPGMAVLFYTSASQYFTDEKYWHDYPVLDQAGIDALVKKQVSMVGMDAGSVDIAEDFPVHKALLGNDILIIENLNGETVKLVGKEFELFALPLKLEFDGAPTRVIAKMS